MASARGLSSLSETERRGGGGREASREHRPINPSADLLPLPEKLSRSRRSGDTVEPGPLNLAGKADNNSHNPLVPGGARGSFHQPRPRQPWTSARQMPPFPAAGTSAPRMPPSQSLGAWAGPGGKNRGALAPGEGRGQPVNHSSPRLH